MGPESVVMETGVQKVYRPHFKNELLLRMQVHLGQKKMLISTLPLFFFYSAKNPGPCRLRYWLWEMCICWETGEVNVPDKNFDNEKRSTKTSQFISELVRLPWESKTKTLPPLWSNFYLPVGILFRASLTSIILSFFFFPSLSPRLKSVSAPATASSPVRSNSLWDVKRREATDSPAELWAEELAPVHKAAFPANWPFPLEWGRREF